MKEERCSTLTDAIARRGRLDNIERAGTAEVGSVLLSEYQKY